MLELLYACGLRVSELTGLTVSQISVNQGVVRVLGKGSKERLIPMGEEALDWLQRYLADARVTLTRGQGVGCSVSLQSGHDNDSPSLLVSY